MGGTFMSLPGEYRDYFVRNLHDALSGELQSVAVFFTSCHHLFQWLCSAASGCG